MTSSQSSDCRRRTRRSDCANEVDFCLFVELQNIILFVIAHVRSHFQTIFGGMLRGSTEVQYRRFYVELSDGERSVLDEAIDTVCIFCFSTSN